MRYKILALIFIIFLLTFSIQAEDDLTTNNYIDPFRKIEENIEEKKNENLGSMNVEITSDNFKKEECIINGICFRGIIYYNNSYKVILDINNDIKILIKNDVFKHNNNEYKLLKVNDDFVLFNEKSFEKYNLTKEKDIGGVNYNVQF